MRHFVLFNGPPRVGKDTVANLVEQKLEEAGTTIPVLRMAFSRPMRDVVFALAGEIYTDSRYEEIKDHVHPLLGVTIRKAMIDLSEKHVKPTYGQDYWGRLLLGLTDGMPCIVLVSDLGFHAEANYIIEQVGGPSVIITRLYRDGHTWDGDSRNYVEDQRAHNAAYHNHEGCAESVADQVMADIKRAGWSL